MAEVTAEGTAMAADMGTALAAGTAAVITLVDIADIAADLRAIQSDARISAALASRHVTKISARCATRRLRRARPAMR
jgi:hypothetical protein